MSRDNYSENGNLGASALQSQASKMTGSIDILRCFSKVKGTLDDDVSEADIISCVESNQDGEVLATCDKDGRVDFSLNIEHQTSNTVSSDFFTLLT